MQPRVVISHRVSTEVMEMLSGSFIVVPNMTTAPFSRNELLRQAQSAKAIMASDQDEINRGFLDQCPSLRIVASTSNEPGLIDVEACTDHGVWLALTENRLHGLRAELEAAANIFEAMLGRRPKGAINHPAPRYGVTRRCVEEMRCRQF